jgi:uncharacterized protein
MQVWPLLEANSSDLDCGANPQTAFIQEHAGIAQDVGLSSTYVAQNSDGRPAGFVSLTTGTVWFEAHERPHLAQTSNLPALVIAQLGVDESFRQQGVAKMLVRFSRGIAQSLRHVIGCRFLTLDCRKDLVPFYEHLGFRESKGEKRRRKKVLDETAGDPEVVPYRLHLDVAASEIEEVSGAPPHWFATELHIAAATGEAEMVSSFLRAGVIPDVRSGRRDDGSGWGATPLHFAAAGGHIAVVRLLLGSGAKIDAVDGEVETPLHWAVRHSSQTATAALLVAGANPNVEGGPGVFTPLAYALMGGKEGAAIAAMLRGCGARSTCCGEDYFPHADAYTGSGSDMKDSGAVEA